MHTGYIIDCLKNAIVFMLFFIMTPAEQGLAQQPASGMQQPDTNNLRVGLAGSSPFVIQSKDGKFGGIAFEIWQTLSSEAHWNYSVTHYKSVSEALDSLQKGHLDIVVGPISITSERAEKMQFSQPYYESSLSIMSRSENPGLWDRIGPFFSKRLLIAVIIFLIILGIVGTLIWLAERKASPEQFPLKPAPGIANGMWLAIVTMSTTGYGDRAPVTFWGRIITGSWMVISIIFATSMVAGIASTLTLTGMGHSTITRINQLSGKKTATIINSPASDFVKDNNAKEISVENLPDAFQKLTEKKVDAVVYDRPQLLYFLKKHHSENIKVSPQEYDKQGYGFAFPKNSSLAWKVDVHLLQLNENNRTNRIIDEWLGDDED